jgi:hypothetical protein
MGEKHGTEKCKLPQPAHEKERMGEGKMLPRCNMEGRGKKNTHTHNL